MLRNCCGCVFFLIVVFALLVGYVYMQARKGWIPAASDPAEDGS